MLTHNVKSRTIRPMSASSSPLNLFQFESAIAYLKARFQLEKDENPSFSIRKWAKESGFGSHALMIMILNGKRNLSLKHVPTIALGLKFSSTERQFFQTLIQLDQAKSEEEKQLYRVWLNDLIPGREHHVAQIEHEQVMIDGIHAAIMVMTRIPGFDFCPETIAKCFASKYSLPQIQEALTRLIQLKYLVLKNGRYVMSADSYNTQPDVPNLKIRKYHQQMARWGTEAIDQQEISERDFQSLTIAIPQTSIPLAKELLQKFYNQFQTLMMKDAANEVYQLNLHFFRLTDAPLSDGQTKVSKGAGTVRKIAQEKSV